MAFLPFNKHKRRQGDGNAVNFSTSGDTLKFLILKSSWTPDRVTPEFVADLTPGTYEAAGYTRPTLSSKTWTLNGSNEYVFDCADVQIAQNASGFTDGRYVVFFKMGTNDSDSPVIAYEDMGSDKSIQGGPLDLQSPNGIFKF
jgi:hypothetical protein